MRIKEIVQQVLGTGYLTVAAENQLRRLLKSNYDEDDLTAFWTLQEAVMTGKVRQESRELISTSRISFIN